MYPILAILSVFTLAYSTVAGRVEKSWVSGPMLFTAFGLIIGPVGLGVMHESSDSELLLSLAELTLALLLFADAAHADLAILRRTRGLPLRLLAIGLPLTILLGFGIGRVLFGEMTLLEIALLATILAPTDAALGKPVVANRAVPGPIRQGLNVESGLNDGICVPILFLFLTMAAERVGGQGGGELGLALRLFAESIGIGLAVGIALAGAGVWLVELARGRGWLSPTWSQATVVALAFGCFGTAQSLGGSGFIASFAGGVLFGALLKHARQDLLHAPEGIGDTFALLTWVLFGAAVVGQAIERFSIPIVLYAVLSLTVIRMIPVFVSVIGLGLSTETKLFLGWFGPRGLASIVFGVIVLEAELPHGDVISAVVVYTVLLSVIAHGVSANLWANAFGARVRASEATR